MCPGLVALKVAALGYFHNEGKPYVREALQYFLFKLVRGNAVVYVLVYHVNKHMLRPGAFNFFCQHPYIVGCGDVGVFFFVQPGQFNKVFSA